MVVYRDFYIDGANFDTPEGFFDEVARATALACPEGFEHSVEGLRELVHSGALLERANEPVKFIWANFEKSEQSLPEESLKEIISAFQDNSDDVYPCYLRTMRQGDNPFVVMPTETAKGLQPKHFLFAALFFFFGMTTLSSLLLKGKMRELVGTFSLVLALVLGCAGLIYKIRKNSNPNDKQIRLKILAVLLSLHFGDYCYSDYHIISQKRRGGSNLEPPRLFRAYQRRKFYLSMVLKASVWALMPRSAAKRSMDEAPKKPSISGRCFMT